jgi:hypothetical protein
MRKADYGTRLLQILHSAREMQRHDHQHSEFLGLENSRQRVLKRRTKHRPAP